MRVVGGAVITSFPMAGRWQPAGTAFAMLAGGEAASVVLTGPDEAFVDDVPDVHVQWVGGFAAVTVAVPVAPHDALRRSLDRDLRRAGLRRCDAHEIWTFDGQFRGLVAVRPARRFVRWRRRGCNRSR